MAGTQKNKALKPKTPPPEAPKAAIPSKGLPSDVAATLKSLGVPIKAWDPKRIEAVIRGHLTLGELAGVSKQQQWDMAATGVKFLKDGLREKAMDVFLGLEALDPYDAYVQVCLGTVALEEELFDVAEERFTKALGFNPMSVPALAYRGEVRLRLGNGNEGMADLEAALKLDAGFKQPPTKRAKALLESFKAHRAAGAAKSSAKKDEKKDDKAPVKKPATKK